MSPAPRVLQNHPAAGEAGSGSWFWMTRGLRVDRDGRRPLSTTRPTSAEGSPAASGSSSRHVSPHLATPAPPERLALLHSLSIVTVCVLPRPDKGLPRGSVLYYLVEWMATVNGCRLYVHCRVPRRRRRFASALASMDALRMLDRRARCDVGWP